MTLKYARLGRAEKLPDRMKAGIGDEKGLVIIETRNPILSERVIRITPDGGIRGYLLGLGNFKDKKIKDK